MEEVVETGAKRKPPHLRGKQILTKKETILKDIVEVFFTQPTAVEYLMLQPLADQFSGHWKFVPFYCSYEHKAAVS